MTPRNTSIRDRHRAAIRARQLPCALCGEPIDYSLQWPNLDCFVVDHITPLDAGGEDTLGNKQPAHARCNRAKSNRLDAVVLRRSGSLR